jgi:hypothetical protein
MYLVFCRKKITGNTKHKTPNIKMFRSIKNGAVVFLLLAGIFMTARFALAQDNFGLGIGSGLNLGSVDPRILAARLIQIILGFLGIIALGLIVYAGFLWMTAAGEEDKVDRAKKILVNAIIGIVIILSAFSITTFILNRISSAVGGNNTNQGGNNPGGGLGGSGVLGACSIESVYPVPDQKDVPRNSSVLITFKEEINPATICASVDANGLCNGSGLLSDSARIYKTADGRDNFLAGVRVYSSADRKNFILSPAEYLGSASEKVFYSVYLSAAVRAANGDSAFKNCRSDFMEWQFEVSNKIDLTPPQVAENGVWPAPDNERDGVSAAVPVWASGRINVVSRPRAYSPAIVSSVVAGANSPAAEALIDKNSSQGGSLSLVVLPDGIKGQLRNGSVSLGAANFNASNEIEFPGILSLRAATAVAAGNSWTINTVAAVQADTLTVGRDVYVFTDVAAQGNQIAVGASTADTAANIAAAITLHPDINAAAQDNLVNISAAIAGNAGNDISLISSRPAVLVITPLSGGADGGSKISVRGGQKDKPMNSIVKINFNEPILPALVVGTADAVSGRLRVINAASNSLAGSACVSDNNCRSFNCSNGACSGSYLSGSFKIANQYKTVEFVSDKQCGVNGCGEPIYCLPSSGDLRVEIQAASLAPCASNDDCSAKSPYNICTGSVCRQEDGTAYPQSDLASNNGIMDASFNSLDGNRDGQAAGPESFYNENSGQPGAGDNFFWSFFISDKMDAGAPAITSLVPAPNSSGAALQSDLEIIFNKPMSASSIKTGSTIIKSGDDSFTHKNINLWSLSDSSVGYWVESFDLDSNSDGEVDGAKVLIRHGVFGEVLDYRAQVGSGVKDAYQNCYKPSSGPGCDANETNPSCCNDSPVSGLNADGNCQ